jgi:hypothetical protein
VNTPPHAAGSVNVVVTTPGGSFTSTGGFTYVTCSYSIGMSSIMAASDGVSGAFNITAQPGCAWSATSDSPWLTTTSSGTGNGTIAFVVAANTSTVGRSGKITVGGQQFTATQSGVIPTSLVATATSTASISVTWVASAVHHFEVWRNANGAGFERQTTLPTSNSYTDNNVVANAAYVYKVRAVDSAANESAFTNSDLATTFIFTDDPIVPGTTIIKAIHITQLRDAINIVRLAAHLAPVSFTDPAPLGLLIKLIHMTQMRNALDTARTALGLAPTNYSNIVVGSKVGAIDIIQLRNGVK